MLGPSGPVPKTNPMRGTFFGWAATGKQSAKSKTLSAKAMTLSLMKFLRCSFEFCTLPWPGENSFLYKFSLRLLPFAICIAWLHLSTPHCRFARALWLGYTPGMKTAISIPDKIYRDAERLSRRLKKSRSQVYTEAVTEYVARHDPDAVTEAMNRVCEAMDTYSDPALSAAARRTLEDVEW